ncbi:hypothetical protein COLO4_21698 [Corchorus olitorius]|uniref:Retrotransposon Copia-like N-terminal domain-containing protein n=1 Tax=Corchorus olitorius TaxID=93759 RepID=A0A1R3IRK2_9ROSI|nr:hypothetical protein COLO4_21698 [Corchorus olitorius]
MAPAESESVCTAGFREYTDLIYAANQITKLDLDNYKYWRAQWVALLNGLELWHLIAYPQTVPFYWFRRQDQLLLNAILISISQQFLRRLDVSQLTTAAEAWEEIANVAAKEYA